MTFLSPHLAPLLWLLVLLNSFLKLSFLVFFWGTSVFQLFLTDFSFHACLTCSSSSLPFLNITMSRHYWTPTKHWSLPRTRIWSGVYFSSTRSVCVEGGSQKREGGRSGSVYQANHGHPGHFDSAWFRDVPVWNWQADMWGLGDASVICCLATKKETLEELASSLSGNCHVYVYYSLLPTCLSTESTSRGQQDWKNSGAARLKIQPISIHPALGNNTLSCGLS